jgi:hypothetical protein
MQNQMPEGVAEAERLRPERGVRQRRRELVYADATALVVT